MDFVLNHSYLIPLLPLIGAVVAGCLSIKSLRHLAHWPIWAGVGASAVLAIVLLVGMVSHTHETTGYAKEWFPWFNFGDVAPPMAADGTRSTALLAVSAGAFIDPLTAVMLAVVCGIGFLITVFAAGYMKGETGYGRFFAYLGLFIFAMTCLVMGDNLILLYLGWEGVGLCSYLLIGYYYDKPAAREAAKKAFIVNRIGDFGFAVGIMLIFYCFGTVSFFGQGYNSGTGFIEMALNPAQYGITGTKLTLIPWIPFALMLGAFGKSAQFPLYVWLPDAMEGPTPVSALIHAATMVTAGVYMIARLGTLFVGNQAAMITIAVVGAFTALFAATIALRQFDLKKVFAYSTVSQLGYMFVAVAVLNPVAAVFHLVTHAFFKALLFLSSGVVMHAMNGELDLRKMSGLKHKLPKTRIFVLIGCLALSGFPLLSGFWSKDEIVGAASAKSVVLWLVLLTTSVLTAYYTFRLYFRVFEGPEVIPSGHGIEDAESKAVHEHDAHGHDAHGHHGGDTHGHGNPEPLLMILPLAVLAIGAVFAGLINLPIGGESIAHKLGHFLGHSPSFSLAYDQAVKSYPGGKPVDALGFGQPAQSELHVVPLIVGTVAALLGIGLAYVLHLKDRAKADKLAGSLKGVIGAVDAKYYVDEIYGAVVVAPLRTAGRLLAAFDKFVLDGVVFLVGFVPQLAGFGLKLSGQRGYLQGYALGMMLGIAAILWLVLTM